MELLSEESQYRDVFLLEIGFWQSFFYARVRSRFPVTSTLTFVSVV